MSQRWNRLTSEQAPAYAYMKKNDFWVYAREYVSDIGYKGGPTNSLILNFKKPPSKKRKAEWKYREKAVQQFKKDIDILMGFKTQAVLTSVPSSKKKDHPEYDNRFEDLFAEVKKSHPQWVIECPVEVKETIDPFHISGKRNLDVLKKNYVWKGFKNPEPAILYIFDDIITTGIHLRAMSDFLVQHNYKGKIIGICWAKTVWRFFTDLEGGA